MEILKIVSVINLNHKHVWAIKNKNIDIAKTLRLTSIKTDCGCISKI